MTTTIARTVVRTVVPLILVTAVALLLQGHNLPGGGFIAGVLTVTAFALVYIIYGQQFLEDEILGRSPIPSIESIRYGIVEYYRAAFALGLTLAVTAGLVPMYFDLPFLTQAVWFLHHVFVYEELEIASALAFDVGVYLVVVGALLAVLSVVGAE